MKSKIILVIIAISALSISCDQPTLSDQPVLNAQIQPEIHKIEHHNIEILEIDGCQYIIYKEKVGTNLAYGYMAHKGNCNNTVHGGKFPSTSLDTLSVHTNQLITDTGEINE